MRIKKIKLLLVPVVLISIGVFLFKGYFRKPANAQTTINYLVNETFESGTLSGWQVNGSMTIDSTIFKNGSKSVHQTGGGQLTRSVSLTAGKKYKVTAWVYWKSVTGGSWGGPYMAVQNTSTSPWSQVGAVDNYLNLYVPQQQWTKVGFSFTAPSNGVSFNVGGCGDRSCDVYYDDIQFYEYPSTNSSPTLIMSANPTAISSIPGTVNFTSQSDDTDGFVRYWFWDFGDGGKSNSVNPSHTYLSNGSYTAKLIVYDDSGASVTQQQTITINDPSYPTMSLGTGLSTYITTSNPQITISGSANPGNGATITKVEWSTSRDMFGNVTGTNNWSFSLNLTGYGGKNIIFINAYDSNNRTARIEMIVNYQPVNKVNIVNGATGVIQNNVSIEQYDKFEATFNIADSRASKPYLPYETGLPAGMPQDEGISIDGIFTSPSGKTYKQPGFLYQPFTRNTSTKQLIATGNPMWKIRFGPPELGKWTYQIILTDASGTTTVSDNSKLTFNVVPTTNYYNHGFLKPSLKDPRYFEFSDGTPFIGVGPAAVVGDSFSVDTNIAKVGSGNSNFTRTWMSAANIGGSSWGAWTGGIPYEGNYPGTSFATDQTYGDSIFSLHLFKNATTEQRCSFYGFQGTNASVKANTNYKIVARIKTVNVTGAGGFTVRMRGTDWPNSCDDYATKPLNVPYTSGTSDWHLVNGSWNSGSNTRLGFMQLTLENVTGGDVYIDEVSVKEDLGNGNLGPEVLPRSKFNVNEYFNQEESWNWDYALDAYAKQGMYEKPVIEEKGDYSFNHISPYGFAYDQGGQMEGATGASLKYQQYYWRYLTARYGYSRAIHSWEFANEQAPGDTRMANQLSSWLKANDPLQHMGTTSFWCCIEQPPGTFFWQNTTSHPTTVDYADGHAYVSAPPDDTSWMKGATYPFQAGAVSISSYSSLQDTALYLPAHSYDVLNKNAAGNKPFVIGEVGIGNGTIVAGNTDTDTKGIWLHQFIWPNVNGGGIQYFIYWYDKNIFANNLYYLYGNYRKFMEGMQGDSINKRIPLNNGNYKDIQATFPAGVNGWGQKDIVNGGAHFWMYDKNYTWLNPTGGSSMAGKVVTFDGLPAKTYIVEYWDTWAGTSTSQTINHPGGTMTLTIPSSFTQKDVAVKIIPQNGYPASSPGPTPTSTPCANKSLGDANCDNKIDLSDFEIWRQEFWSLLSTITADFNNDGKVDLNDFNIWKPNL